MARRMMWEEPAASATLVRAAEAASGRIGHLAPDAVWLHATRCAVLTFMSAATAGDVIDTPPAVPAAQVLADIVTGGEAGDITEDLDIQDNWTIAVELALDAIMRDALS